jgi:D-alanyl-D-alanine carboxypeptidase
MKTGFTNKSKYSLVATAKQNNHHLIAVVLGAENKDVRADVATKMLNLGFNKVGSNNFSVEKTTVPVAPTNPVAKYATPSPVQNREQPQYFNGNIGIQFGAFSSYEAAANQAKKVKSVTGLVADIQQNESGLYRVRVNGLSETSAQNAKNSAVANGIDCYIFH